MFNYQPHLFLFGGNTSNFATSWWFWVILGIVIVFVVYSGLKKNREEKKQRKQREKEVKQLLKKHLAKTAAFQNVTLSYVDVVARTGKQYTRRDVFDVFVKIYNARNKKQAPIFRCFEVEGTARYADPKDKKSAVLIDWKINAEFDYQNHMTLLKKRPRSKLGVYISSFFKGKNRHQYLKEQLEQINNLKQNRTNIDQKSAQIATKQTQNEEIFKPEKPTKTDDQNL